MKLPPHPPTAAPPHFGQGSTASPSVVFQTADTGVFSESSVASDAEETMTPPLPKRPGATAPGWSNPTPTAPQAGGDRAQNPTSAPTRPYATKPASAHPSTDFPPPPLGPLADNVRPGPAAPPAAQPQTPAGVPDPGGPAPPPEAGERTADTPDTADAAGTTGRSRGEATFALARLGAEASVSSEALGPELTPDAILPPGTTPQEPPEPPHDLDATSTGPIPRLGPGPSVPGGPAAPPPDGGPGGSSGGRRALLAAGGLVAALVLGGGGALAVTQLSGRSTEGHKAAPAQPTPTPVRPTPRPSKTKAKHKPKPVPVDIRDEKKDPKPLTTGEVFPASKLRLAGHTFLRVKTVINDHCSLAANGPFAKELTLQHCRRVVRATFVSSDKKLAVTTGIAVMPTDAAAKAALKYQDPAHYEWFRGMKATGAPKIDQAGGFAASTLRGRYICYAYATYADGHKPAAKDTTLKTVGSAFRDSTARPIERRVEH